ncbi:MAG TPA: hypothetical protein VNO34_06365 [Actinomycetota bacterium]|nr:hypothetical protein [Actinomycetota bacterium]
MGQVVDLQGWRARLRAGAHPSGPGRLPPSPPAAAEPEPSARDGSIERLERAVARLEALLPEAARPDGRLGRGLETEVLALIGELSMGLVGRAVLRADRLVARLSSRAATR